MNLSHSVRLHPSTATLPAEQVVLELFVIERFRFGMELPMTLAPPRSIVPSAGPTDPREPSSAGSLDSSFTTGES